MSMAESGGDNGFSTCSYVLKPLVNDVPLDADHHTGKAQITCIELCGEYRVEPCQQILRLLTRLWYRRWQSVCRHNAGGNPTLRCHSPGSSGEGCRSDVYICFETSTSFQQYTGPKSSKSSRCAANTCPAKNPESVHPLQRDLELLHLARIKSCFQ